MLILQRKSGERIHIGDNIDVIVTRIADDKVWLGFVAPADILIVRDDAKNTEPKHRPRGEH